ncbi:MDR family MFS transporter [Angustibacter sp. Root456]|uniref:MDR family MFS transporter n=1 Tax=Angustibacter sp. Root456 TaxID=1736539 RepID=UPI0006FB41F8|nr:MDR family MFS transporter [Angustibacter sp. Root456]KQX69641.1 multidrug MFS transporter [Angustibacter sp. Root456]
MSTTVSTAPSPTGYLPHRQVLEVLWGLLLALFVSSLSATVVGTALPTIVGELGGQDKLAWVATATILTMTVSIPLWGKLSDLYGRKRLFQLSIVVYVVASVFAGMAQNMPELIAARAVQGVGVGGMQALAQAIMADIVSPRERGRYSGYLGASFGLATVAGPLIGGFLVDGPGWRWCFYVGVPFAVAALIVIQRVLKVTAPRRDVSIDWAGAAALTLSASSLIVWLSLGGQEFEWASGWTIAFLAVTVVALVVAVVAERRAADPILPPRLFRDRTFNLTSITGFFVGVALFGVMIYLPQYFQIVKGESPTASGLLTLPMVATMLLTSMVSGKRITATGRWKVYPVVGTALMAVALGLLSRIHADTSLVLVSLDIALLGLGLGLTMQVLVLAVQNAAQPRDIGIATSAANFFRSMGGAVGIAVFGALLTSRLHDALPGLLQKAGVPAKAMAGAGKLGTPDAVAALPAPVRHAVREAFTLGLDRIFLVGLPVAAAGTIVLLFVREVALRTHAPTEPPAPEPSTDALQTATEASV